MLLESSNAETWTPLNGSDLTMRLYGFDFQDQGRLQFQPVNGVQFSDLNIDEYSATPEGTVLVWEYSTDGGTIWDAVVPAEEERLPNLAAAVLVRVRFSTGMSNDTPALNFKDVNLVGYLNNTTGVYITCYNGLTEFIPSPQEKREGLIRDHMLGLVENLHRRIERLEREAGLPLDLAEAFAFLFKHIQSDENRNKELHNGLITSGSVDT